MAWPRIERSKYVHEEASFQEKSISDDILAVRAKMGHDHSPSQCTYSPRFATWQSPRYRAIDDLTWSGVNSDCLPCNRVSYEGPGHILPVAYLKYRSEWPQGPKLRIGTQDFVGAHKTIPVCSDHLQYNIPVFSTTTGVRVAQMFTLPFGAVASVCTWGMVGGTIQQILANVFLIETTRYVGDIIHLEW